MKRVLSVWQSEAGSVSCGCLGFPHFHDLSLEERERISEHERRAIEIDTSPDPLWPDVSPGFEPGEPWDGWTKTRPEADCPLLIEHDFGSDRRRSW